MSTRRDEARKMVQGLVQKVNNQLETVRPGLIRKASYEKYVATDFKFDENGIISSHGEKLEHEVKNDYTPLWIWVQSTSDQDEQFNEAVSELSDAFSVDWNTVRRTLLDFLGQVAIEGSKHPTFFQVEAATNRVLDDLEGRPGHWSVTAMLKGVAVRDGTVTLQEHVQLRKPREEDLTHERMILSFPTEERPRSIPDSILQMDVSRVSAREVQEKLEKLLVLLSLYREAAITYDRCTMIPTGFREHGGTISTGAPMSSEPKFIVRNEDVANLVSFIERLEPTIPSRVVSGQVLGPLEISLKRYMDSLRRNVPVEEKLTLAIMGLESLLLEGAPEKSFRLAARSAQVLSHLNEDPSHVYSVMRKGYKFRSSHVHGGALNDTQRTEAKTIVNDVWRYLRKTILVWLTEGISSEAEKTQFLKDVDAALIDERKREPLMSRLRAVQSSFTGAF